MLWGLRHADVVKISDEETEFLFGIAPEEAAKHIIDSFGVRLVYAHLRCRGLLLQDEDGVRLRQGTQRHSREGHDRSGRYLRRFCDVRAAESGGVPEKLTAEELENIVSLCVCVGGAFNYQSGRYFKRSGT